MHFVVAGGYYFKKSRIGLGFFWCFIFSDRPNIKVSMTILRE